MAITAAQVKVLRDATNAGMMDCKKALTATEGDFDAAVVWLREKGIAIAGKKAGREANQGIIAAKISDCGKTGSLIMVNCETDFVARNDSFKDFVATLSDESINVETGTLAETAADQLTAKIAEVGENLVIAKNTQYKVEGTGSVHSYIHMGGLVGVMVEFGFANDATAGDALNELGKDVAMHIAAANPQALNRDGIDEKAVQTEKGLFEKEVEGKPEEIKEKILGGKLNKFFSQVVLLEQAFIKDTDLSIEQLVAKVSKDLGDEISIKRYERWQIGG